ncbi:MAG: acyl-CoA dehydratase activase-related protein, partial [Oscillospiraceae bacterium]
HYNCPVIAYYPELLEANIEQLQRVKYLRPYFGLHRPHDFEKKASAYFYDEFGIEKAEVSKACKSAYLAYENYRTAVREEGDRIIKFAREKGYPIVVLAGRPYHIDSEINHGIDTLLNSFSMCVITEDAISAKLEKQPVKVLNQWTYHARLYSAANYVATQKDMQLIQLVSFGCGIDAITGDEVRDILERNGKLYTQIKIDEIYNLGAVKIRIRSLLAAMERAGNSIGRTDIQR